MRQYSDFTPDFVYNPVSSTNKQVCLQKLPTATIPQESNIRPPINVRIHEPWTVEWAYSDVKSLSPSPPTIKSCDSPVLRSWIPGSTVEPGARQSCPAVDHDTNPLGPAFVLVWVPILVFVLICGGLCFGCYRKKRLRREAATNERE